MHEVLENVRGSLRRWAQSEFSAQAAKPCEEFVLLKDGKLCGYRFALGNVTAVWMIGDSTIEVRGPGKSDTLVVSAVLEPNKKAAETRAA